MNESEKQLIYSLSKAELTQTCAGLDQPAYRFRQLWHWLYERAVADWREMTNLPEIFRAELERRFILEAARVTRSQSEAPRAGTRGIFAEPSDLSAEAIRAKGEANHSVSFCGTCPQNLRSKREPQGFLAKEGEGSGAAATTKLLLALRDGECVEAVLIPAQGRRTVCVSTQVGCKFKCAFCASGQAGFRRDLESGEMIGQVLAARRGFGARPSHVVFMGIGEPLDNYDQVLKAARVINDAAGLGIGARRITLSTCGIVPGIRRLAAEDLQLELSVSLHAADNDLRSKLMPANRVYPLGDLLAACREYTEKTGRIITFEYTLIRGVNDSAAQARVLAQALRGARCRVNLIPLSAVAEFDGQPAPAGAAEMFVQELTRARINATLRASKGTGVNAACGQLRRSRIAG